MLLHYADGDVIFDPADATYALVIRNGETWVGYCPWCGRNLRQQRVMFPDWTAVREAWQPDDGLRAIRLPDARNEDWTTIVNSINRNEAWATEYTENGEKIEMPDDVREIMARSNEVSALWRIELGERVIVNAHFFAPGEIEFDVDPSEVSGRFDVENAPSRFMHVCLFIRHIGDASGSRVEISAEGLSGPVLMTFDPIAGVFVLPS